MRPDHDPSYARWAAAQRPPLSRHRHAAVRIERAALEHELAEVDARLEVLAARRRVAVAGLHRLRPLLWPSSTKGHGRRPPRVDEPALPPVPDGAKPLGGVELRTACLGLLRRHGALGLRELHGLLHRYGYSVASNRPVQRLADALAYEVRQGRCDRVERGVYIAVAAERAPAPSGLGQPLPWTGPDAEDPVVDPVLVDDPERWAGDAWPPQGVSDDEPTGPAGRYSRIHLDEEVHLARQRCARLIDDRTPPSAPRHPTDPTPSAEADWERFVDESSPMVQIWDRRRREWWERMAALARARPADGERRPEDLDAHVVPDEPQDPGADPDPPEVPPDGA